MSKFQNLTDEGDDAQRLRDDVRRARRPLDPQEGDEILQEVAVQAVVREHEGDQGQEAEAAVAGRVGVEAELLDDAAALHSKGSSPYSFLRALL